MTYPTPSQAEGEREAPDTADGPVPERTTPSQAEGERDDAADDGAGHVVGPTDSPQERES